MAANTAITYKGVKIHKSFQVSGRIGRTNEYRAYISNNSGRVYNTNLAELKKEITQMLAQGYIVDNGHLMRAI
jgi:hypothetical protein